jgi:hypothetical protein
LPHKSALNDRSIVHAIDFRGEAEVQLSIAGIHHSFRLVSRRVAVELLGGGLAAVLATIVFSHVSHTTPLQQRERRAAALDGATANATIKSFMVRAALSARANGSRPRRFEPPLVSAGTMAPEPVRTAAVAALAELKTVPPPVTIALLARHPAGKGPRIRTTRPAVLPPARPIAVVVAVAAPATIASAEGARPFERVMRWPAKIWDTASSTGAFVVDNVTAVGSQFDSVAQRLL